MKTEITNKETVVDNNREKECPLFPELPEAEKRSAELN
jgi:hypothetical protein